MNSYRVEVHQVNIFRDIDAKDPEHAKEIAANDYIWDESDGEYFVYFNIEESES